MTERDLDTVLRQMDNDLGRVRNQLQLVLKELDQGRGQTHKAEHHLRQMEIRAQALMARTMKTLIRLGVQPHAL